MRARIQLFLSGLFEKFSIPSKRNELAKETYCWQFTSSEPIEIDMRNDGMYEIDEDGTRNTEIRYTQECTMLSIKTWNISQ